MIKSKKQKKADVAPVKEQEYMVNSKGNACN